MPQERGFVPHAGDFDIVGEELPVITKQGYDSGYFLAGDVGQHQKLKTQFLTQQVLLKLSA